MKRPARVAAIHDMSGFGRCSLTVVLPVLSAMGAECCPLPTAFLSAQTAFPKSDRAVFLDMTDQLARTGSHWQELGAEFDAIYSGFLKFSPIDRLCHRIVLRKVQSDYEQKYQRVKPKNAGSKFSFWFISWLHYFKFC